MQHFDSPELRYDEKTQERIINLAAELQRKEATSLSRTELENAAAEGGIEPRYVKLALEQIQAQSTTSETRPSVAHGRTYTPLAWAFLALTNIYVVSGMVSQREQNFWFFFGAVAIVAALCARTAGERYATLILGGVSLVLTSLWCLLMNKLGLGPAIGDDVLGYVRNVGAVEVLTILICQALAGLGRFASRQSETKTAVKA